METLSHFLILLGRATAVTLHVENTLRVIGPEGRPVLENQVPVPGSHRVPVLAVTVVAGLTAVLALLNAFLTYRNTQFNATVGERRQIIGQAMQLSPLNEQLSQLIGTLASQAGDIDLRAVLERHGVTLNQTPTAPSAGTTAPAKP